MDAVVNLDISEEESGLGHLREQVPKNRNLVEALSPGLGYPIVETPLYCDATTSLAHTGTLGWAAGCGALAEG